MSGGCHSAWLYMTIHLTSCKTSSPALLLPAVAVLTWVPASFSELLSSLRAVSVHVDPARGGPWLSSLKPDQPQSTVALSQVCSPRADVCSQERSPSVASCVHEGSSLLTLPAITGASSAGSALVSTYHSSQVVTECESSSPERGTVPLQPRKRKSVSC